VAEGLGGRGLRVGRDGEAPGVLREAVETARSGTPVLVNALLGRTEFRKGSISM
jgi:acetolactate synthase-1/2/3 large subunit